MGLWYPKDSSFELTVFLDADHAGCIDSRKSTSGEIQFLGDKLVSWMSKKHNYTVMSSAEAEYVALSASCAQVMWMRTQLQDYGFNYNKIPLYCDSQSAIAISCNPVQHSRTKHIHTRNNHLVRIEGVEELKRNVWIKGENKAATRSIHLLSAFTKDKDHGFVWGSGVVAGKMAEKGGKWGSMFGRETLCLAQCFE
nr:uncharacterized mitochondrial protein AtMg00810-like [Tanacetum cinerariifolium]